MGRLCGIRYRIRPQFCFLTQGKHTEYLQGWSELRSIQTWKGGAKERTARKPAMT